ncbi:spore cortex-lytic hydrolase [[Clostridium] sordellii]|uniref:Spore cortex-lytic hydrolase n=1 Tax=Paraclostridium sordellii TaxID=1505 RepID=A0A9P1PAL1_PARSO|nr:cell wall hydrolase [Paeniclostridium sordellii]MDU5019775.1 cell wall hydrolase [Clostridiales bacterium]AUN15840.1 cell wall hydrolase [Paeniclostridium sordellii]EPZ54292.1 cell Wall Hydrolase family protein [[Clostridium] sordellii VPI 9048] [Paeniclostridium sordellii VPI 9048]MBS6024887.1 cell wall hydrolase [Paeniclostridium sordellii]MBX9182877.1 cell wall hydrolase [Paeniclostridium sordellii]
MNYHTKLFLSAFITILCISFNLDISFAENEGPVNERNNIVNNQEEKNENKSKEVISITNDELYLLSKLVSSEARGESYEGQVAVAAVVINRVLDPRFPDDIKEVIYQRNAFSVVNNGEIYKEPTDSAYKAAREALYGSDPTRGAIYFWNPDIATCNWIKTLDPYKRIGNHVFAK